MTDDQIVTRAMEAAQVIDNPAYKQGMEALRAEIIDAWKQCPVRDKEGQLLYLQLAKLSDKFEGMLTGFIEAGKMAQHKIDINPERSDTVVRRWFRKIA